MATSTATVSSSLWSYAIGLAAVLLYANGRFNTPSTIRLSTRVSLYRQALASYLLASTAIFLAISWLLTLPPVRDLLDDFLLDRATEPGSTGQQSLSHLPAALLAALALTALLPSIPWVKDFDGSVLRLCQSLANIPWEVQEWARKLRPQDFRITQDDVAEMQDFIGGSQDLPDNLVQHLRADRGLGLQISQFRFTRCMKIYMRVLALEGDRRCAQYFEDYDDKWAALKKDFGDFCRRSSQGLSLALKYTQDPSDQVEFADLIREARDGHNAQCQSIFGRLSKVAAGAVLCRGNSSAELIEAFRKIGFTVEGEPAPRFPLHSMTLLAGLLALYFVLVTAGIHSPGGVGHCAARRPVPFRIMPLFAVGLHVATLMITVACLQARSGSRLVGGSERPWGLYLALGAMGAGLTTLAGLASGLMNGLSMAEDWAAVANVARPAIIVGTLCSATAFCCDLPGVFLGSKLRGRLRDSAICGGALAVSRVVIALNFKPSCMHNNLSTLPGLTLHLLPVGVGLIVGMLVPYVYREASSVTQSRVSAAKPLVALKAA